MSSEGYHKWTDEEIEEIGDRYINYRKGKYPNYIVILTTAKIQKVFSVNVYGGKKKAFLAAKEFRDELLRSGSVRTTKDRQKKGITEKNAKAREERQRMTGVAKSLSIIEVARRYGLEDLEELEIFIKVAMEEGMPLHQITKDAEADSPTNLRYEEVLAKLSTKSKMKGHEVLFTLHRQPKPKDPTLIRWQTAELTTAGKLLLNQLDK